MRVYVIRHAAAGQAGDYPNDEERPLTRKGIDCMKVVAKGLAKIGVAPKKIYTSPLVRAKQTAEIVRKAVGKSADFEERDELKPGHAPAEVIAFLTDEGIEEAAIVGHEPQLGELVSLMVVESDEPVLDMKKASVACIDFEGPAEPGQGVVAWHLTPAVVSALLGK